ncbi:MAG: MFS transporter [Chloroflexi bacterium]|nr:MAG: MFS transporter [Chloroflexota bacterium]
MRRRGNPVQTNVAETSTLKSSEKVTPVVATSAEATTSATSHATTITTGLIWVMTIACGLAEANQAYAQPLLADMGRSFGVSINEIGLTNTLSLFGYAVGLLLIVPLGEKYNQRRLIIVMLGAVALALACMATAPMVPLLLIASGMVGLTGIVSELIIPFAARLTATSERGRVVGTVLCGLFLGAPLAGILSGFIGKHFGWRTMYWIATTVMIILAVVLRLLLPADRSDKKELHYLELLGSLWGLLRSEIVLQEVSILSFLVYGAFNAFWVTLSFSLSSSPYHFGSDVVGLFGLLSIVGPLVGLFVGKFTDHGDARYASGIALVVIFLSFVFMWFVSQWLIGLLVGTILLSIGVQSSLVANETRIYRLHSGAWNRLNSIHIFLFVMGGSLGSMLGTLSWSIAKRDGVYATACLLMLVALGFYIVPKNIAISSNL